MNRKKLYPSWKNGIAGSVHDCKLKVLLFSYTITMRTILNKYTYIRVYCYKSKKFYILIVARVKRGFESSK
ncbi:hypothetical protein BK120_01015 [Paenibacillus sp. FSL A5-0031]|nr:hypothetical protein BK120_01015 [Paenibacillus sp. FSL A5-0031]